MKTTNLVILVGIFCLLNLCIAQNCDEQTEIICADNATQCCIADCRIQCMQDNITICKQCESYAQASIDFVTCSVGDPQILAICTCDPTAVNLDGVCSSCRVQKCILCSYHDHNKCDICIDGFIPNFDQSQCISECPLQSHSSCQCLPNYSNTGSSCEECAVENCQICAYNDQNICDLCLQGYIYENNGAVCSSCGVKFCSRCKENNPLECEQCFNGYEPLGSTSCQIPACSISGQVFDGESCNCAEKQYLSSTECKDCPENCEVCNETQCTSCLPGYYLDAQKICQNCVSGCLECTQDNSCDKCQDGLIFSESKICESIPDEIGGSVSTLVTRNGQVQQVVITCSGACIQCSSQLQCNTCSNGYYLQYGQCKVCGSNCKTCRASNPVECLSCYQGKVLSNSKCITCPLNCFKCANKDLCTQCLTGYFSSKGVCQLCPDNCEFCGNTGCDICQPGYTSIGTQCVQCLLGCSKCSSSDLSCLSCNVGFYGQSGQCKTCRAGCSACTQQSFCTSCSVGYRFFDSQPICYEVCAFPCLTCQKNGPTACQSCYEGYIHDPNSKVCNIDTSCNANNNCVACSFGKALINKRCEDCNIGGIQNCLSCLPTDLNTCSSCKKGFYLSQIRCLACPSQCISCNSPDFCKKCKKGFYLEIIDNQPTGQCLPCSETYGCATCSISATQCKSCLDTMVLQGQKCITNTRISVSFLFTIEFEQFMLKINSFRRGLGNLLQGPYANNPHLISFKSLRKGSVNAAIILHSPNSTEPQSTKNFIQNLSQGQDIGGVPLGGSSVQIVTVNPEPEPEPEPETPEDPEPETPIQQESNLALILGLSIPLGLVALFIFFIVMKKSGQTVEMKQDGVSSNNNLMKYEQQI